MTNGYKTITPIQFANMLSALAAGKISLAGLRVYFACFAMLAVREAAARCRKQRRQKPRTLPRYRIDELQRLTALSPRAIKAALRDLASAGLVSYGSGQIVVTTKPIDGSEGLLTTVSCGRSPKRPIPVPRAMLRFLAQCPKVALSKTIAAYLLRGLSLSRSGGEVAHKGTVKASWIAKAFGLSERAVSYARAELVPLGWISRDTNSFQRKLNRDGAYFVIDLDWSSPRQTPKRSSMASNPQAAATETAKAKESFVIPHKPVLEFAPLPGKTCIDFAPPPKDKKTSYEVKNQKTQDSETLVSGFFGKGKVKSAAAIPAPRLNAICTEDLFQLGRLEELFAQASEKGWIHPSEAMTLNFVAAAVRARAVGKEPPKLFVAMVKRGLWQHITQGEEEHARRALARIREADPERFRMATVPMAMPLELAA